MRFIVRPPTSPMRVPTPVEPVNDTMSMSRVSTSASPVAGVEPVTTLTTPGGKPTSCRMRDEVDHRERVLRRGPHHHGVAHRERGPELARHVDDREVVRRDARDRADRLAARDRAHQAAGRERGGRHLLRRQRDHGGIEREPRRTSRSASTRCGTCICLPTVAVQPVSAITVGSRSLKRALIAAPAFASSSARTSGVVCDQAGNASCAARAASSACAADASGATPDDLFGGGVHDVVAAVGSVDPLAADQQLRRSVTARAKCNAFYFPPASRGRAMSGRPQPVEAVRLRRRPTPASAPSARDRLERRPSVLAPRTSASQLVDPGGEVVEASVFIVVAVGLRRVQRRAAATTSLRNSRDQLVEVDALHIASSVGFLPNVADRARRAWCSYGLADRCRPG